MRSLLLGVDIGTTGVRGALFDRTGALVAEAHEACPFDTPRPGYAEADPEAWWGAVQRIARRVGRAGEIAAVGVTGQAPTVILEDAEGRVLRPAILWLDTRSDAEAKAVDAALGPGVAERLGGNRMHAYYAGAKLAWLARHEPETLARAAIVLQSHAFVAHRLTGRAACDRSTAALSAPLYDATAQAWSETGIAAVGVRRTLLPEIVRAQDVLGGVTAEAARATGLLQGTPVVAGGGDFAASALGAGVVEEGEACLMLGTAGNLLMPLRAPGLDARLINAHHVGCERALALGGTLCGAAIEWFRKVAAQGASFDELEAEAARSPPGANGVLFLPYLQGERTPIWNVRARGVFFGLDLAHERGDLYRAVLEGIALGFRHCREVVRETGAALDEVVAANGAGKSALFRQILADTLGARLTYVPRGGGTVAGAAILAGLGVGLLPNADAARAWRGEAVRHEPNAEAHARYEERFRARLALYASVEAQF